MRLRLIVLLVAFSCICLTAFARTKNLVAVLQKNQTIDKIEKTAFVKEIKDGILVEARLAENDGTFTAIFGIENKSRLAVGIDPEKLFLINANDKSLYRYDEASLRMALFGSTKTTPSTKDTTKYTVRSDGQGGYQVERDPLAQAGNDIGASIAAWRTRRDARKAIEDIEKSYARYEMVKPGDFTVRKVMFEPIAVSSARPLRFVISIYEGPAFVFVFK